MQIATFTSGNITQIGTKHSKSDSNKTIDSRILFNDPSKFRDRYLLMLDKLFGITTLSKDDTLIFSLNGVFDKKKKEIVESDLLNQISFTKFFNGFSFVESLGDLVGDDNVHFFDSSICAARGVFNNSKNKNLLPTLFMHIGHSVEISVIKTTGISDYESAIRPLENLNNKSAFLLLSDRGINELLFHTYENVAKKYTDNLIEIIKDILFRGKNDGFHFKQILLHSNKSEYIYPKLIENSFSDLKFSFTDDTDKNEYLILEGVFNQFKKSRSADKPQSAFSKITLRGSKIAIKLAQAKILNDSIRLNRFQDIAKRILVRIPAVRDLFMTIDKIEYCFADTTQRHIISDFSEFTNHWLESKPVHSQDNYYVISYKDGTRMKVYLDDLKSITDVYKYNL